MVVGIRAFVERHDDVCAQVLLDRNRFLGGEAVRRAINVTLEGHTVVIYFARLHEREDLKAARVGEHRIMPLHEFVQATHIPHQLIAGTQVEMIGVAEHERGMDVFQMFGREGLDRCLRADRRENGREEIAVRHAKGSRAGAPLFCSEREFKHEGDYTGF